MIEIDSNTPLILTEYAVELINSTQKTPMQKTDARITSLALLVGKKLKLNNVDYKLVAKQMMTEDGANDLFIFELVKQ